MNGRVIVVIVAFSFLLKAVAQDTSGFSQHFVSSGLAYVSLVRDLSSENAKPGDKLELRYLGEIKDGAGKSLIRKDAKLFGTVTESVKRDKQHSEARLAIIVDRVESEGKTYPVHLMFCGPFSTPPQATFTSGGTTRYTLKPMRIGLPGEVQLEPPRDSAVGSVLVSATANVEISSETTFFVCELKPVGEPLPASKPTILVPESLPAGVRLAAELAREIDTAKVKPGDLIELSLMRDLIGPGNTIAIPKGATIKAKVMLASPASSQTASRLVMLAQTATWNGGSIPLHAFVGREPVMGPNLIAKVTAHLKDASVDLSGIQVKAIGAYVAGYSRENKTILLPAGTVVFLEQAD